jgi:hypothetical protein
MRVKHDRPSDDPLNHEFWTANQVSTLDALRGYLATADLLCLVVIEHQGSVKQLGLAYFPVDTTRSPLLHPLDSFQARNSVDVTEVTFRRELLAKISCRSFGYQSEEVIGSKDVPQAVVAQISTYISRSQMNERGLVLVGWSMFESAIWVSKHCPQLLSTGTECFIGWADVQDYAQYMAGRDPSDFPSLEKTISALHINNEIGQSDEKLATRAGHKAVRVLQVLVGLDTIVCGPPYLEIRRHQKPCRLFTPRPGTRMSEYPFVALLKPSNPFQFLPLQLSRTKSEFLHQFPQAYQPIAIGFERWRNGRPHFKGLEVKRAYVCFASAAETDRFVSEVDRAVVGDQSIEISRFQHSLG